MDTKPRLVTLTEWKKPSADKIVNGLYSKDTFEILSSMLELGYNWKSAEQSYEVYKIWYSKTYSKLGQALK